MALPRQNLRRLSVTRSGFIFLLIIFLLLLAAFNTGENLFYLVTSAVSSILLLSLWASRKGIRRLTLQRRLPESVHRDEPFGSVLTLRNDQKIWPAIGLSLNSEAWQQPLWLDGIAPGEEVELRAYASLPKRGLHPMPPVEVTTSFPFGVFERTFCPQDDATVLVFPKVYPLRKRVLDDLDDSGQSPKVSFNDGDEFFSLREYVPGDDIRHISWKISARLGTLIIRELEPSISRMVLIVFDTRCTQKTIYDSDQLERAMDLAASLAINLLDQHFSVGLAMPGQQVDLGKGKTHGTIILETLALAKPLAPDAEKDDWFQNEGLHAEATKIYLSADPTQWGVRQPGSRARTLNPDEALHG